jgi:hypothetical protein
VHSVETVVSIRDANFTRSHVGNLTQLYLSYQLISVISLLSQDVPDLNSPANVDAAKQVREDFAGEPSHDIVVQQKR